MIKKIMAILILLISFLDLYSMQTGTYILKAKNDLINNNYLLIVVKDKNKLLIKVKLEDIGCNGCQNGYIKNLMQVGSEYLYGQLKLPDKKDVWRCKIWTKNNRSFLRIYGEYDYYTYQIIEHKAQVNFSLYWSNEV